MTGPHHSTLVLVGALTKPVPFCPDASGDGIVTLALDSRTGRLERLHYFRDILNPSYLAWARGEPRLYAAEADFNGPGRGFSFEFEPNGRLAMTGTQPLSGSVACHVCMLPHNAGVCVASYLNACIDTFALREGKMLSPPHTHRYQGSGPDAQRQETAHAHQALVDPSGRHLFVCDLGSDCIWIHKLTNNLPADRPAFVRVPAGYGPRHLAFHPALPMVYVLCELKGHVLAYSQNTGTGHLTLVADLPALPDDRGGQPSAAAIHVHPSGRALFASQRSHHTLTIFSLSPEGIPGPVQHKSSGGREPRDFNFDPTGRWLIVANQSSNNLTVHEMDPSSGIPTTRPPQQFSLASPNCVVCTDRPYNP